MDIKRIVKGLIFVVIISVLVISNIFATSVNNLYIGEVAVSSMDENARESAIQQALQQVLVKISGDSSIINQKNITALLAHADDYVSQYNYASEPSVTITGIASQNLQLQVQFDKDAVNNILHQAKLRIWSKQRPLTLVWLAIETEDGRQLIGSSSDLPLVRELIEEAKSRAIPVILPTLDLQDLNNISVTEVWNGQVDRIRRASQRYAADAVLVGHLTITKQNKWDGNWQLLVNNKPRATFEVTDNTVEGAMSQAMSNLADDLAKHFVVTGTQGEDFTTVSISGINSYDDYERVRQYLLNMPEIKKIEADTIEPKYVIFHLQLNGLQEDLTQRLQKDPHLKLVANDGVDQKAATIFHYQWAG